MNNKTPFNNQPNIIKKISISTEKQSGFEKGTPVSITHDPDNGSTTIKRLDLEQSAKNAPTE